MLRLKILSVGKTKESWLEEAIALYERRLKPHMTIEWIWAKNDDQLQTLALQEPLLLCLDPEGLQMTSEAFSSYLEKQWALGGARLAFVIGGAEGLPPKLKEHSKLISLSKMTFTHQMTRLILIEQIYRAYDLSKGGPYHKGS